MREQVYHIVVRLCHYGGVPRVLDTDRRRREIGEAALRVLVAEGPGGLSVRKVAAEAGLPPSSLRYVFPSQAAIREQALSLVAERIGERVAEIVADDDTGWARRALYEVLPLDPERRLEMEAYLALASAGREDPAVAEAYHRTQRLVREVCGQALVRLIGPEAATDDEIDRLTALVDGLALHLVRRRGTPEADGPDAAWAVRLLDADLARLPTARGTRTD